MVNHFTTPHKNVKFIIVGKNTHNLKINALFKEKLHVVIAIINISVPFSIYTVEKLLRMILKVVNSRNIYS